MFHQDLKAKLDQFVDRIYECSRSFPNYELFGVTSQLRRASLSVVLNYTEGYGRLNQRVNAQFLRIAYASLKEAMYLIDFSKRHSYLPAGDGDELLRRGNEIARMLWGMLRRRSGLKPSGASAQSEEIP